VTAHSLCLCRVLTTLACAVTLGSELRAQAIGKSGRREYITGAVDTIAITVETQRGAVPVATAVASVRQTRHLRVASWELTYQWLGNDGSRTADTLWVDQKSLMPLENHRHNGILDGVTVFERSAAHTRYTPRGETERRADTTVVGPLYASGELEILIRSATLRAGYSARYTLYYGPPGQLARPASVRVVRSETIVDRSGKSVECWVVDAPLSEGLNTFYVSKVDHRVIRLVNHEDPNAAFVFNR
jgi:hypothetical protein